jgi:hypothetical protein
MLDDLKGGSATDAGPVGGIRGKPNDVDEP